MSESVNITVVAPEGVAAEEFFRQAKHALTIKNLDCSKLQVDGRVNECALVPTSLILKPGDLTRNHLGKKVQYQRVRGSGQAKIVGVIEMIQHGKGGFYGLELAGGTAISGSQDDGATIEFV